MDNKNSMGFDVTNLDSGGSAYVVNIESFEEFLREIHFLLECDAVDVLGTYQFKAKNEDEKEIEFGSEKSF
jgi:hypothetical protein